MLRQGDNVNRSGVGTRLLTTEVVVVTVMTVVTHVMGGDISGGRGSGGFGTVITFVLLYPP